MFINKKICFNCYFRFLENKIYRYFLNVVLFVLFFFIPNNFFPQSPCSISSANCDVANSDIVMDTPANKELYFDTFAKYAGGLTLNGSTILKVKVASNPSPPFTCQWKLVMIVSNGGISVTPTTSEWESLVSYGSGTTSNKPTIEFLQVRVSNGCGTPQSSGVWQNFNPVDGDVIDIINPVSLTPAGGCNAETNGVGTYLGPNYNEFSFTVDYRVKPEYLFTPGRYELSIKFCLVEK